MFGGVFSREKGKSGYDGTDDNHQIRVVICTVFFSIKGIKEPKWGRAKDAI